MLKHLIMKNRSYRRFYEEEKIPMEDLRSLIDLARLSPSGANLQSLKYVLTNEEKINELIFEQLKWAGYLKNWAGPEKGERPAAYIIIIQDESISKTCYWDHGIASQSILLGATEQGYGGCQFGAFNADGIRKVLKLSDALKPLVVIALGKPKEVVLLEDLDEEKDIKYYRDEKDVHHVPKRNLKDIIIKKYQ
ncbi:MAG TPA: nitroreductase family protein [Clostridia bacterium]|nr:nitroreductase family protein [Clostridia bacterium]